MKIEEYLAKLADLERSLLPWDEYKQKIFDLQAEYLAEQAVPDAEKAIILILEAQERGELPELNMAPVLVEDWECEFLELNDNGRPDKGTWRCRNDDFVVDVSAEDGEVDLISV